ncbi:MAG: hypothetical protein ACFFBD_23890 [Candidatus Hodarchaeota archaeon]
MISRKQKKSIEWRLSGKLRVTEQEEEVLQILWQKVLEHFDSQLLKLHAAGKLRSEVINQIAHIFHFNKAGIYKSQIEEYTRLFSQEAGLIQEVSLEHDRKPENVSERSSIVIKHTDTEVVETLAPEDSEKEAPISSTYTLEKQPPSKDQSENLSEEGETKNTIDSPDTNRIPPPKDITVDEVDRQTGLALLRKQMLDELKKIREIDKESQSSDAGSQHSNTLRINHRKETVQKY